MRTFAEQMTKPGLELEAFDIECAVVLFRKEEKTHTHTQERTVIPLKTKKKETCEIIIML